MSRCKKKSFIWIREILRAGGNASEGANDLTSSDFNLYRIAWKNSRIVY